MTSRPDKMTLELKIRVTFDLSGDPEERDLVRTLFADIPAYLADRGFLHNTGCRAIVDDWRHNMEEINDE